MLLLASIPWWHVTYRVLGASVGTVVCYFVTLQNKLTLSLSPEPADAASSLTFPSPRRVPSAAAQPPSGCLYLLSCGSGSYSAYHVLCPIQGPKEHSIVCEFVRL